MNRSEAEILQQMLTFLFVQEEQDDMLPARVGHLADVAHDVLSYGWTGDEVEGRWAALAAGMLYEAEAQAFEHYRQPVAESTFDPQIAQRVVPDLPPRERPFDPSKWASDPRVKQMVDARRAVAEEYGVPLDQVQVVRDEANRIFVQWPEAQPLPSRLRTLVRTVSPWRSR